MIRKKKTDCVYICPTILTQSQFPVAHVEKAKGDESFIVINIDLINFSLPQLPWKFFLGIRVVAELNHPIHPQNLQLEKFFLDIRGVAAGGGELMRSLEPILGIGPA